MRTIQQQIDAKLAVRKPMAAKMDEIMQPVIKDDVQLDDAAKAEYDGLTKSVADLDADIVRLEALERSQSGAAAPVVRGNTVVRPRAVVGVGLNTERNLPPGIEFAQAMICKMASAIAVRKGEFKSALDFAKERYPDNDAIALFLKGPIAAGNTTDQTWAEPLVATAQTLVASFLDYLRPRTIIGQFGQNGIPALNRVPFNIRYQSQTSGGAADWVGEVASAASVELAASTRPTLHRAMMRWTSAPTSRRCWPRSSMPTTIRHRLSGSCRPPSR